MATAVRWKLLIVGSAAVLCGVSAFTPPRRTMTAGQQQRQRHFQQQQQRRRFGDTGGGGGGERVLGGRRRRVTTTASLTAAGTTTAAVATAATAAAASSATTTTAAAAAAAAAAAGSSAAAGNLALVASVGVLTLVITLHEVGHLVAALSQGIKVEAFSVGLGPKLLSYRPATGEGGFFKGKLSGPFSSSGDAEEEVEPVVVEEAKKATSFWAWGKKEEKQQEKVEPKKEAEGVEYTLRAIPVGGYVSFPNNYEVDDDGVVTELDDPDLLYNRGPFSRAIVVAAGVVVNFTLAWACIFGSVTSGGIVQPHYDPGLLVNQVTDARGGAAMAGIKPKDVLLSINGNSLAGDSTSVEKAVRIIRGSAGKPVAVEVARPGSPPTTRMVQTALGSSGKYTVGVLLAPNLESVDRRTADNPAEAAGIAFKETSALATKTLDAFVRLASTGQTEDVSGPVEIVRVGAEVARADGPSALLQFAAVISVNLAVINSLPVPGLDGGQMVFVLAEIVSGKKLDRDVSAAINGVALLILFAISLSTFAGDLGIATLFQRILGGAVR